MWRRRALQRHPEGLEFDARWGTETCAFDWDNYEPSRPSVMNAALDALDIDVTGATFVDWGCGKGRACLLAAQRPFFRVMGVDHDPALIAVANANLAAFDERDAASTVDAGVERARKAPVYFFVGDAARQPLPDGPLVVYLYNPFGPEVLGPALRRVHRPEARVVYMNPLEAHVLDRGGWTVISEGGNVPWQWRVYRPRS